MIIGDDNSYRMRALCVVVSKVTTREYIMLTFDHTTPIIFPILGLPARPALFYIWLLFATLSLYSIFSAFLHVRTSNTIEARQPPSTENSTVPGHLSSNTSSASSTKLSATRLSASGFLAK